MDKSLFSDSLYAKTALAGGVEAIHSQIDGINADKSPVTPAQIDALKQQATTDSAAYRLLLEMGIEVTK